MCRKKKKGQKNRSICAKLFRAGRDILWRQSRRMKKREKDGLEEDVVTDSAAGKTLNKARKKKHREAEEEGGGRGLLNFTRSRFTKRSQSRAHIPSYCLTPLTRLWHPDHNVPWTQKCTVNLLPLTPTAPPRFKQDKSLAGKQPLLEPNCTRKMLLYRKRSFK